jgi:hypothetical protein
MIVLIANKGKTKLTVTFPLTEALLVKRRAELLEVLGWTFVQVLTLEV